MLREIVAELQVGDYRLFLLDSELPKKQYNKLVIDDVEYMLVIVYDLPKSVAIKTNSSKSFVGEIVEFKNDLSVSYWADNSP